MTQIHKSGALYHAGPKRRPIWEATYRFGFTLAFLVAIWHLTLQQQPYTTLSSSSNELWWQTYVQKSLSKGPLKIPLMPFELSVRNDEAIIQVLQHFKVDPQKGLYPNTHYENLTIIDIGLPTESVLFAKEGYSVEAFEARTKGIQQIERVFAALPNDIQQRIHLHHSALSNVSDTTMQMYDANDSSSLLESAIQSVQEKSKFESSGQRMETVGVNELDRFIAPSMNIVAVKIDTQGVEPEIFMGSQKLFSQRSSLQSPPIVIVTEYCTTLRSYEELRVGPHLLSGLGYTCYIRKNSPPFTELVLDSALVYCGDFVCIHHPSVGNF
ncbi:FkbM family methyltransferase [Nitzschia inconspicua]|uniref:FkbM family methyltransferase n=1 Tax=Nitzschia inconspicua TaxID=303405 RepID=A0A9K3PF91_9STRA|nr:FkbM family methyltransferase [Nitzschia inconspicua]